MSKIGSYFAALAAAGLLSTPARAADEPNAAPAAPSTPTSSAPTPVDASAPVNSPAPVVAPAPGGESATPESARSVEPAPLTREERESTSRRAPALDVAPRVPPTPIDEPALDDHAMGSHQRHLFASIGYRGTLVKNAGFDLFSEDDALNQFSLALGAVVLADDRLSFAAAVAWDYGEASAAIRGAPTELHLHRLTIAPEVRYHIFRRFYAFGRVGAGIAAVKASWDDAVARATRAANHLAFTVDPSAGLALEIAGENSGVSSRPRLWLLADAGYLVTTRTELVMGAASGSPARTDPINLGSVALSGASFRVLAAVSY
jgi:hypothetical protein